MMTEPKVRFKRDDGSSYPAWREYSISDLFTKIGDKNKDGQNTNVITNSAEFGLIPQRDYFDKDIAVEGNTGYYTIIQTGDFVYNPRKSSYAPMGPFNCYRLEEDGIVSPLYSCLRPKGVLNPEYLLWYFQTDKWYDYVNDHGAQNGARHDRVGMTDKILMGIPVTAPCAEEQQKIADFLSSVDEVITASEEEVANLETQKKAVMKKIFSQEVRFKRADGSDFPVWEEKVFTDVAQLINGRAYSADEMQESGKYMILRVGNLFSNNEYYYSDMELDEDKYIDDGDLIYAWSATFGPRIYRGVKCIYHYHIWKVIPLSVEKDYFLHFLYADVDNLQSEFNGGTMKHITKEVMEKRVVPLPCQDEQNLIARFLSAFDEAIASAKKELELWKELKKGLLQQMFV